MISKLNKLQLTYRELYKTYDPYGEIAVHIELDNFLSELIKWERSECGVIAVTRLEERPLFTNSKNGYGCERCISDCEECEELAGRTKP